MATASAKKTGFVSKVKVPSKPVLTSKGTVQKPTKSKKGVLYVGDCAEMAAATEEFVQPSTSSRKSDLPVDSNSPYKSPSNRISVESIGCLVCISGAQVGTLRYFGETHFENGLWCGIECDDDVGKNDGSVHGIRYFKCKDKYGIFAPLSKVRLLSAPPKGKTEQGNVQFQPTIPTQVSYNRESIVRPSSLRTNGKNKEEGFDEDEVDDAAAPIAPTTTPVSEEKQLLVNSVSGTKRMKKEAKRVKDSPPHPVNQQQKKKRKLDTSQALKWSGPTSLSSPSTGINSKCTPSTQSPCSAAASETMSSYCDESDLPNLLTVKLKEEILSANFRNSPFFSPLSTYSDTFPAGLASSTPDMPRDRRALGARFARFEDSGENSTPKSSRRSESKFGGNKATFIVSRNANDSPQSLNSPISAASAETFSLEQKCSPSLLPLPTSITEEAGIAEETTLNPDLLLSPTSSTKEDINSDLVNLDAFPAKRPSCISLFPGFSSEESSEQGIFGVSTPELIGGDGTSLALSIPASCCSSPGVVDNDSSLGLLTPSHLQDCWNSNTNDDDIYQHLRSPSVDDLEEFEEEDKTVDQDLLEKQLGQADNYRGMSSSLNGAFLVNENDGLVTVRHPMYQSLHEELYLSQGKVRRDRTYTQFPTTIANLNYSPHHLNLHQKLKEDKSSPQPHCSKLQDRSAHQSFRESGSASETFTDSDFNTESEADQDECSSCTTTAGSSSNSKANQSHVNNTINMKNRNARVIDGALYHSQNSNQQSVLLRQESATGSCLDSKDAIAGSIGKSNEMISSAISVSVSSNSASACASEMESSGFYSDASSSERNPSGSSVMSESDGCVPQGMRSSRHLSKSSSDCDDSSVAMMTNSTGLNRPLRALSLDHGTNEPPHPDVEIEEILEGSSLYEDGDISLFERSEELFPSFEEGETTSPSAVKPSPPALSSELGKDRESNGNLNTDMAKAQQVPICPVSATSLERDSENEQMDLCEDDMEVDLFEEYDEQIGLCNSLQMKPPNNNFSVPVSVNSEKKANEVLADATLASSVSSEMSKNYDLNEYTVLAVQDSSFASQESELERMELDNMNKDEFFCGNKGSGGTSSPKKTNIPVVGGIQKVYASALHGNLVFDTGLGGGGGKSDSNCSLGHGNFNNGDGGEGTFSSACLRSQSVNCIASLTSSTSSASTVTAKSCVTSGAPAKVASYPSECSLISAKQPGSSKISKEAVGGAPTAPSVLPATTAANMKSKVVLVKANENKRERKICDNVVKTSGTKPTTLTTTTTKTNSVGKLTNSKTASAGQSSVTLTTTTSDSNPTRSSRADTSGGKSSRKSLVKTNSNNGESNLKKAHASHHDSSTISSSLETRKTRSGKTTLTVSSNISKCSNRTGSTRSLASVGSISNNANHSPSSLTLLNSSSSSSVASAKKLNKWDAVMSKIAETKHKPINVKNVKSKVFLSGKSGDTCGGDNNESSAAPSTSATSGGGGGKTGKVGKALGRLTVVDRTNENDPLVPSAFHKRQHQFSSRSSTVSDSSSVDDHPQRAPPTLKHRVKKDVSINRRQVSDVSSASEYSVANQNQRSTTKDPPSTAINTNLSEKNMTVSSGTKKPSKTNNNNATSQNASKSVGSKNSTLSTNVPTAPLNSSGKSPGTKGAQTSVDRKKAVNSSPGITTRGVATRSKVGSSTVSSHNDPSTKAHPAVKPLRDRNRLGPVGKNYGAPGLDANANESADGNNRGQSNGEIGKSNTKTADGGVAEPLIDSTNHGKKSVKNRVSAANQQNIQNSLLVQENSSLKEEVNRLSSVVADLQQQIAQLASSEEETRKTLEGRLVKADLSCTALSIVAQQVDQEKNRLTDELSKERAQRKEWKLRLDEKLIELQNLQDEYEQEREYHQEELRTLSSNHEIEVDVTVRNCENKLAQMQKRHDETLAELKRSHNDELERLQESQRQELKETVQKHRELLDQHRNQSPHDILHKEVESLQAVLEMRNEEIRVLRKDLMDYKNTLNDLQMAREHGKSLQAKIEDLEAQLEKARADKRSLQERYQMLDARRQQLESESSRLARCNDELTYKLKSCNFVEN